MARWAYVEKSRTIARDRRTAAGARLEDRRSLSISPLALLEGAHGAQEVVNGGEGVTVHGHHDITRDDAGLRGRGAGDHESVGTMDRASGSPAGGPPREPPAGEDRC